MSDVIRRTTYVDGEGNKLHEDREDYRFWCLGCDEIHGIRAKGPAPVWTFNGDMIKPTFSPSHITGWHEKDGKPFSKNRCHSFIKEGMIQYLSDCHHALKGQTVRLPPKSKWRYGN